MPEKVLKLLRRNASWIKLEKYLLRRNSEKHREGIEYAAAQLRKSGLFDVAEYEARTACRELGYDGAFHYVLHGDRAGYATASFDPVFYASRYADVADGGGNRLLHYINVGRHQGRFATKKQLGTSFDVGLRADRPVIYIVCHEASRTGAPILGWNLCRLMRARFFVVAVVFKGGGLLKAFESQADLVVVAPSIAFDRQALIDKLTAAYPPVFAVVNSLYSHALVPDLVAKNIPFVALIQEFAPPHRDPDMQRLFSASGALVFASETIMKGSTRYYEIAPSKCHLQPQGQSLLPPITDDEKGRSSTRGEICASLAPLKAADPAPFIVAGIGSVESRKGVDLFLSTAASIRTMRPDLDIRFVWVGGRSKAPENEAFNRDIDDQIEKSDLGDRFLQVPPAEDLDAIYETMSVFFLSSRLDPMPNVAIDAALAAKPVVCFHKASGFADILRDNGLEGLTLPYLDLVAAANLIIRLAEDRRKTADLGRALHGVATRSFVMEDYVALIEKTGYDLAGHGADAPAMVHAE